MVKLVHDKWFAYGRTRVYGPCKTEWEAWRALREDNEDERLI